MLKGIEEIKEGRIYKHVRYGVYFAPFYLIKILEKNEISTYWFSNFPTFVEIK